jgi:hypothetical protein
MKAIIRANSVPVAPYRTDRQYSSKDFLSLPLEAVVEVEPLRAYYQTPVKAGDRSAWLVNKVLSGATAYKGLVFLDEYLEEYIKEAPSKTTPWTAADWQGPPQPKALSSLPSTLYAWVNLNVRADPNSSGKILKKIPKGTKVTGCTASAETPTQLWAYSSSLGGHFCVLDGDKSYAMAKAPPKERADTPLVVKLPQGATKVPLDVVGEGSGPGLVEVGLAALGLLMLIKA